MTSLPAIAQPLVAIFRKQLRHYRRYPGEFGFLFIIPYFLTALVAAMGNFIGGPGAVENFELRTGTNNPFVYQILGAGVWMIAWIIVEEMGTSLRNEQIKGTLEQNFLAPINRFLLLVGTALSQIVITFMLFAGIIVASVLVLLPQSSLDLIWAFFLLMIGLIPLFGLGFVFAALVIRFKEPYAFTQAVNVLFAVVTGTYYPVTILPVWVRYISSAVPQTHVIADMRLIVLSNATLVNLYGSIFILLAMGVVYPFLGYSFFKFFERRARVSGDLSRY